MSRLKFSDGNKVWRINETSPGAPVYVVQKVEPALERPYLLNDMKWYGEDEIVLYTPTEPSMHDMEEYIKDMARRIRNQLSEHNVPEMLFSVRITGSMTGNLKIEYGLHKSYIGDDKGTKGYSIQHVIDEYIRREAWNTRNKPDLITQQSGTDNDIPF